MKLFSNLFFSTIVFCLAFISLSLKTSLINNSEIQLVLSGLFLDDNNDDVAQSGERIRYTYEVSMTGNEIFEAIEVEDYLFRTPNPHVDIVYTSGDSNNDDKLNAGETWIFTADYALTDEDINCGSVNSQARANAIVSGSQICTYSDIFGSDGDAWDLDGQLNDFSNVGYNQGSDSIPNWPVGVDVQDFGALGNGIDDDTQAFRDAIAACPDSSAIWIPNGKYKITDWIRITDKDNFVLRGEDMYETILFFPNNLEEIRPENDYTHARGGGFMFFEGGTQNSMENFSLEFRDQPFSTHFAGTGANGIFTENIQNSWIRNIYVKNANLGLRVSGDNITVMNIVLDHYTFRPQPDEGNMVGHYGITIYNASYCLVHDVHIRGKYYHDIGSHQGANNNVFSKVNTYAEGIITHKAGSDNSNLYTEFDLGEDSRLSSISRANTVYWNIKGGYNLPFPSSDLNNIVVGYNTSDPPSLATDHFHDTIHSDYLCPPNLYLAQLEFANKPLPAEPLRLPPFWPAPDPSQATAIEDTYVSDRDSLTLGDKTIMILANRWNRNRIPFAKFDFTTSILESVENATLRLYRKDAGAMVDVTAIGIEDDLWNEDLLTYDDFPSEGVNLDTITVGGDLGWYEWDVTAFVNDQLDSDKIVSFCLKDLNLTGTRIDWISKESAYYHPELILTPIANAPPQPPLPPEFPVNVNGVTDLSGTSVDSDQYHKIILPLPCDSSIVWSNGAWSNGRPKAFTQVQIEDDYNTEVHGSFSACSLVVSPGSTLTVSDLRSVYIYGDIEISELGNLVIEPKGGLTLIKEIEN